MDWAAAAKLLATALGAIDQIITDVRDSRGEDARVKQAADALTAIGVIVQTVKNGDIEKLDPSLAEEELRRLLAAISDNDASADGAMAEKFDTSETPDT